MIDGSGPAAVPGAVPGARPITPEGGGSSWPSQVGRGLVIVGLVPTAVPGAVVGAGSMIARDSADPPASGAVHDRRFGSGCGTWCGSRCPTDDHPGRCRVLQAFRAARSDDRRLGTGRVTWRGSQCRNDDHAGKWRVLLVLPVGRSLVIVSWVPAAVHGAVPGTGLTGAPVAGALIPHPPPSTDRRSGGSRTRSGPQCRSAGHPDARRTRSPPAPGAV
jgi:hypothetical protein